MLKNIAITLALFGVITICHGRVLSPRETAQHDLDDFLAKSANAMQRNPEITKVCFETYSPQLNALPGIYEQDLNKCETSASSSTDKLNKELAGDVDSIGNWRNDICNSYNKCNEYSDPQGFFECNNAASGGAITTSYSIQSLSKDKSEYVKIQLSVIQSTKSSCTNTAYDEYRSTFNRLSGDLSDCLDGKITVAPTEPTTPAASQ